MKRLKLLNPCRIRRAVRQIRDASEGGGPQAVRLAGVSSPRGVFIPTSRVGLEVIARDGSVTRFDPELPVPFPYAWGYRIARRLGVPLVSSFDTESISARVPLPRR